MEENKGILEKIKEIITKIFKGKKYKELPPIEEKKEMNNKIIDEETHNNKEKNEFKQRISNVPELSNIDTISTEEEKRIKDSVENFYFKANLDGYKFISSAVINENSPLGSYACYLIESDKLNIEEGLPVCCIPNKNKLRIVEGFLKDLENSKGKYNKDLIKNIMENGFELNGEKFFVSEDYHLNTLLNKIISAENENEIISIPIDYMCKAVRGYQIEKSPRLKEIEKEQRKKQEEKERKNKYYDAIKKYIIQGKSIELKKMSTKEARELKDYYRTIIDNIEKDLESDEYLDLGIEYITKLSSESKDDLRYSQILKIYSEINKEIQQKKHLNKEEKINLSVQKGKANRVIKNVLLKKLKDNLIELDTQNIMDEIEKYR